MDNAISTFEQILHQSLEAQGTEELCRTIQRCQDRVLKVPHHAQHEGVQVSCMNGWLDVVPTCAVAFRSLTTTAAR